MLVGKCAEAKYVGNGFIAIITNQVGTRKEVPGKGRWDEFLGQRKPPWGWYNGQLWGHQCSWLGASAFDTMKRPLHVAFCSSEAWIEILEYQFLTEVGHPLRNPLQAALSNLKIFGLHNNWCENLTLFACVCTKCINAASVMPGWGLGNVVTPACGA